MDGHRVMQGADVRERLRNGCCVTQRQRKSLEEAVRKQNMLQKMCASYYDHSLNECGMTIDGSNIARCVRHVGD